MSNRSAGKVQEVALPIIGKVGRRSWKVRALNTIIHIVLLLGAATMIYPFMMMVSASFKSHVDSLKFSVYPRFFLEDKVLYKKYIEARYNEESNQMLENYKGRFISFEQVTEPQLLVQQVYADWRQFLQEKGAEHDLFDYYISEQFGRGIYPRNERIFRQLIKTESEGELENFNRKYDTSILSWEEVRVEERDILSRNFTGDYKGFLKRYEEFRSELSFWNRVYCTLDGNFIKNELMPAYRSDLKELNSKLGTDFKNWNEIKLASRLPETSLAQHWENYVRYQLNIHHVAVLPPAIDLYKNFLREKYDSIELLNRTYNTFYQEFSEVELPQDLPRAGADLIDWTYFVEAIVPVEFLTVKSVELDYRNWLTRKYKSIATLNQAYGKGYNSLEEVPLAERFPAENLQLQEDWTQFARSRAALGKIGLLMTAQAEYLAFLETELAKFDGSLDLAEYNRITGSNYERSMNIYPSPEIPVGIEYRDLWLKFLEEHVSGRFITIQTKAELENWHVFLRQKYATVSALNDSYHLTYKDFDQVEVDHYTIDHFVFREHQSDIFWEFVKRNYVMVLDLMLYNGRAIMNTMIYCLLAIITALIINPLAAYAMSRYKLRSTYKILLILMLTMAFPPMVMGIPNFLLLKRLNLLNTFWALILPAAADGYFIFLLKGFFDSLPQELFESATMDGAGEGRIFWQIAMSLSKPIMAVIALGAFNAAYRNFMFAFIVCQDKSMWTMMVHIYQLIQRSAPGVGFAALVIAAIPTFAVFVFFQNIIIRGIVVPTEK